MIGYKRPPSGEALEKETRKQRVQFALAQRASKRRKSLLDHLAAALIARASRPKRPEDDFMRDEICDAGIGFSVAELEALERQRSPRQ